MSIRSASMTVKRQRSLEDKPRGPRRALQKLWADKEQRDEIIRQVELAVRSGDAWSILIRVCGSPDGAMAVSVPIITGGSRNSA